MSKSSSPHFLHRVRSRLQALPHSAQSAFLQLPEPQEMDRIIFFAPHPDDEALAAGGYLHRAVKNGAACYVILITDGNKRGLKDVREREFVQVLDRIGIAEHAILRLDYPNGSITKNDITQLTHEIAAILDKLKPTIVFTPHPADLHREHVLISDLVMQHKQEVGSYAVLQYLIHYPPQYPSPRSFSPHSPLLPPANLTLRNENWQLFLLTEDEVLEKKALVELYSSQLKTPFLRSLMYALIRQNELFLVYPKA